LKELFGFLRKPKKNEAFHIKIRKKRALVAFLEFFFVFLVEFI
jgi:hypothetical protein